MDCSMPGFPVLHYLLESAQTHAQWVGDAIQPSHLLLSPSPAFILSQHQGLFQWVSSLHQVAKVLKFQLQNKSSNEYSRLFSFGIDCLDLLTVQGTLKNLLQHCSSKASILWRSAFFMVQLSHPYMTTVLLHVSGSPFSLSLNTVSLYVYTTFRLSSVDTWFAVAS